MIKKNNEKYTVTHVNICPLNICEYGVKPNLNEYPETRLCVIDNENLIAVDVEHELKYEFIETMSGLYLINRTSKDLNSGKRYAIFPYVVFGIGRENLNKADKIIEKLENGFNFPDGNEELSNEKYLAVLSKKEENQKTLFKRKK